MFFIYIIIRIKNYIMKKKIIIFNPSLEDGGVEKNLFLVSNYLFSKDYLIGDVFFTEDTLYTILWDCRICNDNYLLLKDAPENKANPYIVAIPLYEFKLKGSY